MSAVTSTDIMAAITLVVQATTATAEARSYVDSAMTKLKAADEKLDAAYLLLSDLASAAFTAEQAS